MWTPRRILLVILGLFGFSAVYMLYARVLGGIDGLPELPAAFLTPSLDQDVFIPETGVSPTQKRLEEAFGPASPEVLDNLAYKTKLEMRDKGIVLASGQPVFTPEPSRFVTVSPFSLAFFGKPKPAHLRQPGEVQEISTFHADKAILEFDRPVSSPQELGGKAKMIGMELLAVPDMPSVDVRRGQIVITNNQKSPDPGQFLVFRTPGPLFYRSPEHAAPSPDAPQIWTSASVEIIDKKNLPRPIRSNSSATASVSGDDLRHRQAISEILLGHTLPPPTILAEGMKVYLQSNDAKAGPEKRNNTGYSGVRLIELNEKVQMNLWTDGGSGFPGSENPAEVKPMKIDPPALAGAIVGGLADAEAVAGRFEGKSLLLIETLGSFRYDFAASRARFEAAVVSNPALSNHVTLARLSASGKQDDLSCKLLVIDFAEPPDENAPKSAATAQPARAGMKVRQLQATGPHVYVSVEAEQLSAQGTELIYKTSDRTRQNTTTLRGMPVVAVREGNRLEAGSPGNLAEVLIVSTEPAPGSKDRKQTKLNVNGPGRITIYDQASNESNLQATWGRSLSQEREVVGKVEQDLLKFEGGASFIDTKGDMSLSADRIWLWLSAGLGQPTPGAVASGPQNSVKKQASPQRLLAVGNVRSQSTELHIEKTDQMTVWFRDVPPPTLPETKPPAVAAAPAPKEKPTVPGPPSTTPPPPVAVAAEPGKDNKPAAPPPEPEKPKPPVKLSARVIESWVVRYPVAAVIDPKAPKAPAPKPGSTTLKYELERARCDDRVVAHQEPADPAKNPRGLHIEGAKMHIDQSRAGSVMRVDGTNELWAQVHFESMSLFGPIVVIDQPKNEVTVDGRGALIMPSQSELGGGDSAGNKDKPTDLEVHWARSMRFEGAKSRAEFVEAVQAVQQPSRDAGPREVAPPPRILPAAFVAPAEQKAPPIDDGSWNRARLLCHELKVTFDRPIYFNNMRQSRGKSGTGKKDDETAKLKTASCTPMPDDEVSRLPADRQWLARKVIYLEETFAKTGKTTKAQRIDAQQIDMKNDEREQQVFATGPGEVRLFQQGSKSDDFGKPTVPGIEPKAPMPDPKKSSTEDQEMKLTVVKFTSRMVAKDTRKVYQEATFDDGARVWHIPTENMNLVFDEHHPPKRTFFLECNEKLTVSSDKTKKEPEQWMTALGNGTFRNDDYEGNAYKITYDNKVVVMEGAGERLAKLYRRRVAVGERNFQTARQIFYYKDGTVKLSESSSGSITPGP